MTAAAAVTAAIASGISMRVDGDRLVLSAEHPPDKQLLDDIRSQKVEIVAYLRDLARRTEDDWEALFDERAAVMEYDGGLERDEAEALARKEVAQQRPVAGRHV